MKNRDYFYTFSNERTNNYVIRAGETGLLYSFAQKFLFWVCLKVSPFYLSCLFTKIKSCLLSFQVGISLFTVSHRKSLWTHHDYYLKMDGRGDFKFGLIAEDTEEFGSWLTNILNKLIQTHLNKTSHYKWMLTILLHNTVNIVHNIWLWSLNFFVGFYGALFMFLNSLIDEVMVANFGPWGCSSIPVKVQLYYQLTLNSKQTFQTGYYYELFLICLETLQLFLLFEKVLI